MIARATVLSIVLAAWVALPAAAQTFSPELRLSSIAGPSISPKLAAGSAADDLLHAVWSEFAGGAQQILYSRTVTNGDTWSAPIPLSIAPAPGTAVVPAIAANGNKVVVTWTDTIVSGDLYYRISTDAGASWLAPPQALYPAAGYSRPSGALVDSAGRIHIAWFDSRATGYGQLFYTMSCDNGTSWSPLSRVNPQDDGVDNESPRLAEGADGTVYMLYRSSRDGNPQRGWPPFDHYLLRSTAVGCGTGAAWLYPSQRVSQGLPEDLGNTYGGQLVAGQNGRMHMAWWRESSGNNLAYRGGFPKPSSAALPGFRNPVDVSRFGPNHLEFDLNTAEIGGFGLGEDSANVTHMVFAENNHLTAGFQVGPLYYARSTDGGLSFEPKQVAATGSEATEAHAVYHNGRFHMIWADFRDNNQGAEIYYRNLPTVAAPTIPGPATITANPYGPISVQGASLAGSTITFAPGAAVIQLGAIAGTAGSLAKLDFQGLNVGSGSTLTIRSGAAAQKVVLYNADASASVIGGTLQGAGGNGAPAPEIYLHNPNGITVNGGGNVSSASGVTVDTLGASAYVGQILSNAGVVDGGSRLRLLGARITGGGAYKGNDVFISSFGNVNNPVNGAHYLSNGLQLYPSTGGSVALTLNDYGTSPQIMNVMINGNGTARMPTAWPPGDPTLPNNAPIPMGGSRPPGVPEPLFGGGGVIVQSTGSLSLLGGTSNDFAFPGSIVLKALGTLDFNGVLINQGWTTSGKQFQGVFFESPNIVSTGGNIRVLSNNLNWINFSALPHASVRAWQLVAASDGSAQYVTADAVAPHLNVYSLAIETAAAGGCWVCLINTQPVNMQ